MCVRLNKRYGSVYEYVREYDIKYKKLQKGVKDVCATVM